jgi:single-stranded-DNA-specific exonuclease
MEKRWKINEAHPESSITQLSEALQVEKLVAQLLLNRGIDSFEKAKSFFRPSLEELHNPYLMEDMTKAVNRIERALNGKEKIMIFGDYDVDGTTAVALVFSYFQKHTSLIEYYIPDRYSEGYGVSTQAINYAKENGISLIIALDCGIKSVEKITYAKTIGVDFIVCDHHLPGEELPPAIAILNPKVPGCKYPYKELCGCGIGFKLVAAFDEHIGNPNKEWILNNLDLVAVSIAADIVPITGENRTLVYHGVNVLNKKERKGFAALLDIAAFQKPLTVTDIVFTIAPRINAAGRLTSGKKAVELLISDETVLAAAQSEAINNTNSERKTLDKSITEHALLMLENESGFAQKKSTVVFHPEWHKGVVGIVASRLTEKYYRPTIVLTESNGKLTGSARSVKNYDVHQAIEKCGHLLEQFGGHKYAAGLTLDPSNLEQFKTKFESVVSSSILDEMLVPEIEVEASISLQNIDAKLNRIIKQFAPFGPGNMAPVFVARKVMVKNNPRIVGVNHVKVDFIDPSSRLSFGGIAFQQAHRFHLFNSGFPLDICFTIDENEYQGTVTLQLNIKDVKASQE